MSGEGAHGLVRQCDPAWASRLAGLPAPRPSGERRAGCRCRIGLEPAASARPRHARRDQGLSEHRDHQAGELLERASRRPTRRRTRFRPSPLVSYLGADVAPLQQLNQKIQGDTTVTQARQDFSTIFTGFRVYLLVLPASPSAVADRDTTTVIPASLGRHQGPGVRQRRQPGATAAAHHRSDQPDATAASAANGLSTSLLAYTPAQFNANHTLLAASRSSDQAADRRAPEGPFRCPSDRPGPQGLGELRGPVRTRLTFSRPRPRPQARPRPADLGGGDRLGAAESPDQDERPSLQGERAASSHLDEDRQRKSGWVQDYPKQLETLTARRNTSFRTRVLSSAPFSK